MNHNFSLELTAFSLAQDLIQACTKVGENSKGEIFIIDGGMVKKAYLARLGEEPNHAEIGAILMLIADIGPDLTADCSTFLLARHLFHLLEFSEEDKRAEAKAAKG